MNKIKIIVAKILNFSLFLHVSDDANYDTIEQGNIGEDTHFRFSVLYIPLGDKLLYFFSFKKEVNSSGSELSFKALYEIKFDEKQVRETQSNIEDAVKKYEEETLKNITECRRCQQEEFMKLRIAERENSMSAIYNKINYHTTIMLAFSAVLVFIYSKVQEIASVNYLWCLIYYLLLINFFDILSLGIFLRKSIQVKGFYRSSFKELRISEEDYALAKSLYRDWYAGNSDVSYFAGMTKNSEKLLFRVILNGLIVLLFVTFFTSRHEQVNKKTPSVIQYPTNYISSIHGDANETIYHAL
ncbi:hypothetical protein [Serratia fonticola]